MSTKEAQKRIELLILRTLLLGPAHGHAIAKAIEFRSDHVLQVEQGSPKTMPLTTSANPCVPTMRRTSRFVRRAQSSACRPNVRPVLTVTCGE
jgi:hypothetical protein